MYSTSLHGFSGDFLAGLTSNNPAINQISLDVDKISYSGYSWPIIKNTFDFGIRLEIASREDSVKIISATI